MSSSDSQGISSIHPLTIHSLSVNTQEDFQLGSFENQLQALNSKAGSGHMDSVGSENYYDTNDMLFPHSNDFVTSYRPPSDPISSHSASSMHTYSSADPYHLLQNTSPMPAERSSQLSRPVTTIHAIDAHFGFHSHSGTDQPFIDISTYAEPDGFSTSAQLPFRASFLLPFFPRSMDTLATTEVEHNPIILSRDEDGADQNSVIQGGSATGTDTSLSTSETEKKTNTEANPSPPMRSSPSLYLVLPPTTANDPSIHTHDVFPKCLPLLPPRQLYSVDYIFIDSISLDAVVSSHFWLRIVEISVQFCPATNIHPLHLDTSLQSAPTTAHTTPSSLLVGMSAGLPAIAVDVKGIPARNALGHVAKECPFSTTGQQK
ncbi:hypothetical protein BLNAU_16596 [Blattamonas nauphoetae]|uniref:Uncharacterized protein n=1 Tax=Blattamonas nauphoetae TaxID=2049346 RepID=A0ABQ9XDP9_9EUKA|nr:hypothetical protein BLNAU_16596 [Blattamonas nauphoetae]